MNGKQAKKLRHVIYGDLSYRNRAHKLVKTGSIVRPWSLQVIADERRAYYQRAKKLYKRLRRTNE